MVRASFQIELPSEKVNQWMIEVEGDMESKIILGIRKGMEILLKTLKENTPEDTKTMLNSYTVQNVYKEGNAYIGTIGNTVEYAVAVEFGVKGRIYKYQKPKGNKGWFEGVGNKTFKRTMAQVEDIIYQTIEAELWK